MTPTTRRLLRAPGPAAALALALLVAGPVVARAQQSEPLRGIVVDVRGAFATLPTDPAIAEARGIDPNGLPSRALGFEVGGHVYPWGGRAMTLGLGASVLWSRGLKTLETVEGTQAGPEVTTRLQAVTPQVSLNFGTARGWSYLSGGVGWSSLTVSRDDRADEPRDAVMALNLGGGARWLFSRHAGFSFDLRFYRLSARDASAESPGHPSTTRFVVTAGLSFK